jgi:hypothetical protein
MLSGAERDRIIAAVRVAADRLLTSGWQGTTVEVPELGETWTISREQA